MGRRKMPMIMKFYAYKSTDSEEPSEFNSDGTSNADWTTFTLKTYQGAKRRAQRLYGSSVVLFECEDFQDRSTWLRVL